MGSNGEVNTLVCMPPTECFPPSSFRQTSPAAWNALFCPFLDDMGTISSPASQLQCHLQDKDFPAHPPAISHHSDSLFMWSLLLLNTLKCLVNAYLHRWCQGLHLSCLLLVCWHLEQNVAHSVHIPSWGKMNGSLGSGFPQITLPPQDFPLTPGPEGALRAT